MKCVNCHYEILGENPTECPNCHSKNLIPIEDEYPPNLQSTEQNSSIYKKPNNREAMFAVLGTALLILGIILLLYGSKQPPNIVTGTEFSPGQRTNIFWFIGLVLMPFDAACWGFWLFEHVGKMKNRKIYHFL